MTFSAVLEPRTYHTEEEEVFLFDSANPGFIMIDGTRLTAPKVELQHSRYPDKWASIAYLFATAIFVWFAVLGIPSVPAEQIDAFQIPIRPTLVIAGIAVIVGAIMSTLYLFMMLKSPRAVIIGSLWASVIINLTISIIYFVNGILEAGILVLLFALLIGYLFFTIRNRIDFAALLLKTTTEITWMYPATIAVSLLGALFAAGFFILWTLTSIGLINRFGGIAQDPGIYFYELYHVLYMFWSTQIFQNVVHVTVCGVFGLVYFEGQWNGFEKTKLVVPVKNPTFSAFKNAVTTCFGPVCFGSLLNAILALVYALTRAVISRETASGNVFLSVICCCCLFCSSFLHDLLEYFNLYAYVQVAIHNKGYVEAGKATWELAKTKGIDAIINDLIIGMVLVIGGLSTGIVGATLNWGFRDAWSSPGTRPPILPIVGPVECFMISTALFLITTRPIQSGCVTLFVGLAEDPSFLARQQPELFALILRAYPSLVFSGSVSPSVADDLV